MMDQGDFQLVGPNQLIISSEVWPTTVRPGSTIELHFLQKPDDDNEGEEQERQRERDEMKERLAAAGDAARAAADEARNASQAATAVGAAVTNLSAQQQQLHEQLDAQAREREEQSEPITRAIGNVSNDTQCWATGGHSRLTIRYSMLVVLDGWPA